MSINTQERKDDEYSRVKIPKDITHGNITLKCPLYPLSNSFGKWINECFSYADKGTIKAYDMVIKLLGANGKPVAGWLCSHAYPINWSLGSLDASKSELAIESIVMTCNRLKRITNI